MIEIINGIISLSGDPTKVLPDALYDSDFPRALQAKVQGHPNINKNLLYI